MSWLENIIGRSSRISRSPDKADLIPVDATPTPEEEGDFFDGAPQSLQEQEWRQRLNSDQQDQDERLKFHDRAFAITCVWVFMLILLPMAQILASFWDRGLTEGEFIAVITSNTAAIFGFWMLVGNYLFRSGKK